MKRRYSGMTLIEILMVAGIIIIMAGLLIPAMTMVRKGAKVTKQRAELNTIELAITTFRNDDGDYPPSTRAETACEVAANDYSGAQKLAEALCGWDLLGFNPNSCFRSNGTEPNGANLYSQNFANPPSQANLDTLRAQNRRGPYLDMTHIGVFKLNQLFDTVTTLAPNTYVLCDIFGVRNVISTGGKRELGGTPILYYRANTASKDHMTSGTFTDRIYNVDDNRYLADLRPLTSSGVQSTKTHPLSDNATNYEYFYNFIRDRRAPITWPHNPESYILISAGPDGEYGTKDDICNFPTP